MNSVNHYASCVNEGATESNELMECVARSMSSAQDDLVHSINVFFIIYAASLVFFMQAGFAMICSGAVRKKNVQNTMLKNLLDACGSALSFFSVGYAFAFGGNQSGKTFIGSGNFFLIGLYDQDMYSNWLFQFAFAATSGTIVAGTMAERCQMNAYFFYSILLCGFVYPVVAHNIWSDNGIFSSSAKDPLWGVGVVDFAGAGVVHVTGGVTAIIATKILGPRKGRFYDAETEEKLEEPLTIHGHSKSLQILGTFILWFGWYGFNAGSALNINGPLRPMLVANAVISTTLSGAASGVSALITNLIITERLTGEATYNLTYTMNGCLAGLVAITGGCAVVEPWAAVVIGIVSGWIYLGSSHLLVKWCIDDAVDAIPVHLCNGIWGVIATGLFANYRGLSYLLDEEPAHLGWFYSWGRGSGDATLLACQIVGILFIIGWVTVIMVPFFILLNYFGKLRADGLEEIVGLDISYHGFTPALGAIEEDNTQWLEMYNDRRRNRIESKRSKESDHDGYSGVDKFG